MESLVKDTVKTEAAPALTRGLELLALLARDGQSSLETLVRKTGWPKSSLWRYLQALESIGAVRQDFESKRWEALQVLRSVDSATGGALESTRSLLPQWAAETECCTELYRVQGNQLILVDRAEPEDGMVAIKARIGFERDLTELDATALVFFAFQKEFSNVPKYWCWHEGRCQRIGARVASMRVQEAKAQGYALDNDFNENGFRRFAKPILDGEQLLGVLAVVQRQTPRAEREKVQILKTLKSNPTL
ncbi:helix-turn-helix domain-containing protein [Cerasicoccus maritimus]|uniref:helix-turn-helix domain-containing protein n=1 Tax=Cerasicoccus maritimus TaxID=490089 RepID=UPI002852A493|nr:helix-turn-helix domain-containing protein [Cerasicoccus maritimus]